MQHYSAEVTDSATSQYKAGNAACSLKSITCNPAECGQYREVNIIIKEIN